MSQPTSSRQVPQDICPPELLLSNQLCFPLYAASKEIVRRYTPLLKPLNLTYTQYICLMVLWETPHITSRELGQRLYLDSGTLTPLLKKLEDKGLLLRRRDKQDARQLYVELTPAGSELRERASAIPQQLRSCVDLNATEAAELKRLLEKLLATL